MADTPIPGAAFGVPARAVARGFLDLVLPPQCLACGALTGSETGLCAACWQSIEFIAPPLCACCGWPFEGALDGAGGLCASCAAQRPPFAQARSVFRYDEASRGLIIGFKHADRTFAAPAFARWMARAGAELLDEADIVVPVPLHRWRLFRRRYNQAALLALALARLAGRPCRPGLLRRLRATPSQGRLSRRQRRLNVRGAFAVAPGAGLAGERVLLIDDVMTTGATVEAAARALLRGGAGAVDVLTLARVVRPMLRTP